MGTKMGCEHCSNLRPPELQNAPGNAKVPRWIPIKALRSSECDQCRLIWKALQLYTSDFHDEDFAEILIARSQPLRVKYRAPRVSIELYTRDWHEFKPDEHPHAPYIGTAREVSECSGDAACFDQAAKWLKECKDNHRICQVAGDSPLPTRVIDVGAHGIKEPFLVETNGASGPAYAALSYCWGWWRDHPPMKTVKFDIPSLGLKANYDEHLRAIRLGSMPKTLQDAVTICRKLGIRYLWVDALCIVQHDAEEWLTESGKMCQVYSNAALTISATRAEGSSAGIFGEQEFGTQRRRLGGLPDGRAAYARQNLGKLHDECDWGLLFRVPSRGAGAPGASGPFVTEPLAARAWCMQESLLSNRLLHYTSDEMVWECNEARWCECGFGAGSTGATGAAAGAAAGAEADENPNVVLRRSDVVPIDGLDENFFWRTMWSNYLHPFTRRGITDGNDKLPALSGLARQFSDVLERRFGRKPTYLAGLWGEEFLMRSLLWYVSFRDPWWRSEEKDLDGVYNPRRSETWRAPTWSWMSLDAPISPQDCFAFESALEVVETTTEPVDRSADPFGRITSGKIVLHGRLIQDLDCRFTGTDFHLDFGHKSDDKITFSLCSKDGNSLPFVCDVPWEIPRGQSSGYSLLLLGYKVIGRSMREPCFLVLRAGRDGQAGCYERIGLVDMRALPDHMDSEDWDIEWAEDPRLGARTTMTII